MANSPSAYALIGLTAIVACLVTIVTFALLRWHTRLGNTLYGATIFPSVTLTMARYAGLTHPGGSRTMDLEPIVWLPVMRTKALLVAVLLSLGVFAPLAAQSLADVSRQEEERRKVVKKPSKVLTNGDLRSVPGPAPSATAVTAPAGGGTTPAAAEPAADAEKKAEEPAKDQAYWSSRAKDLQTQLTRNETFAVALQARINALANEYTNQGDGVQQQAIATERQRTIDELNRLTKEIEDGKKAVASLQEDARRAGVPPGWLR